MSDEREELLRIIEEALWNGDGYSIPVKAERVLAAIEARFEVRSKDFNGCRASCAPPAMIAFLLFAGAAIFAVLRYR